MKENYMRKRKIVVVFVVFILSYAIMSTNIIAFVIFPNTCNFSTNQYNLSWYYVNQGTCNMLTYVITASTAWNYSAAPITWHQESNYGNMKVYNTYLGEFQAHGFCKPPMPNYFPNNGWIIINESCYNEFVGHTSELIAHEFGHALRLGDVADMSVLMRLAGYKGNPQPTADDVAGVDSVY